HGRFWRCSERLPPRLAGDTPGPAVAAVIPARNEADAIGATIRSLLNQRYGGALSIVVVDDGSSDGTAEAATSAGAGAPEFAVLAGRPLPPGWSGKLWAQQQGLAEAERRAPSAAYVLLSDADIAHADDAVER